MYIKLRVVAAICRLGISILSTFSAWLLFHIFGNEAWRLFPTWITLLAAGYYIILALATLLGKYRETEYSICPTLQGAIIVSSLSLIIFRLLFNCVGVRIAGLEGAGIVLIDFILPIAFVLDWLLFTKKGAWRSADPFYWLALPTCYAFWIILSAEFTNLDSNLRYPYSFLDFYTYGIDTLLAWFALDAVLFLILGYSCLIVDFVMSGKLASHVVLPRIKTIIIEEEIPAPAKLVKKPSANRPTTQKKLPNKPLAESTPASKRPAPKSVNPAAKPVSEAKAKSKTIVQSQSKAKKKPVALLEAHARSVTKKASVKDANATAKVSKTAKASPKK